MEADYYCHRCHRAFGAALENEWGMYEFKRCPRCGSARTTLA